MRRALLAAAGIGVAAVVAACSLQAAQPTSKGGASDGGTSTPAAQGPVINVSPADMALGVLPSDKVSVTTTSGALQTVALVDPDGKPVAGTFAPDHRSWTSSGPLDLSTRYQVHASAKDGSEEAARDTEFRTVSPDRTITTEVAPLNGETVGVGMPIAVYFTSAVPTAARADVERRLSVTMSTPVVGAWHWMSSKEIHYRPQNYWPSGEKVTLKMDLARLDLGGNVWADDQRSVSFTIGDSHISTVDANTHQMVVTDNGQVVKTMPVSTGRDKYPTASGIHVVLAKQQKVIMDSATVGIPRNSPDGYYETVYWNTRISWSGEFVHAAPWSVADQGQRNVSHGCVNVSTDNAQWFYNFSRRGDIVNVINTPKPLAPGNGYTDWNVSWPDWLAGSALS